MGCSRCAAWRLIGTVELGVALLIALRPLAAGVSAVGSLGGAVIFVTTLSFLLTTPGAWQRVPGFPLPVPTEAGGFLLKDLFLLGAAAWSAGKARRASRGPA
jgi:uncharacterized membrane protein YkgB